MKGQIIIMLKLLTKDILYLNAQMRFQSPSLSSFILCLQKEQAWQDVFYSLLEDGNSLPKIFKKIVDTINQLLKIV